MTIGNFTIEGKKTGLLLSDQMKRYIIKMKQIMASTKQLERMIST